MVWTAIKCYIIYLKEMITPTQPMGYRRLSDRRNPQPNLHLLMGVYRGGIGLLHGAIGKEGSTLAKKSKAP